MDCVSTTLDLLMFVLLIEASDTGRSLVHVLGTFVKHLSWQLYPQSAHCIPENKHQQMIYKQADHKRKNKNIITASKSIFHSVAKISFRYPRKKHHIDKINK